VTGSDDPDTEKRGEIRMPPEPGQVVIFIIGTIVILFGAYYVTYFVGMKASGQNRAGLRNRNITVLDRYAIARDKQFCIIEVAGKVYIIGVTNHTMTLLDTFDAAAFAQLTENNSDTTPWDMTPVGQYGNKLTRKIVSFIAEKTGKKPPAAEPVSKPPNEEKEESASDPSQFADTLKKAQDSVNDETYTINLSADDPEEPEEN